MNLKSKLYLLEFLNKELKKAGFQVQLHEVKETGGKLLYLTQKQPQSFVEKIFKIEVWKKLAIFDLSYNEKAEIMNLNIMILEEGKCVENQIVTALNSALEAAEAANLATPTARLMYV